MKDEEVWKDIEGYEGIYQISNHGRIKSLERTIKSKSPRHKNGLRTINERILKGWVGANGYQRINLKDNENDNNNKPLVHQLVGKHFVKNPFNYKILNHKDSDKLNNYYKNLEWCTNQENCIHSVQNDTFGSSTLKSDYIPIIRFMLERMDMSQKFVADIFGVARKTINDINTNRTWSHLHGISTIEEVHKFFNEVSEAQDIFDELYMKQELTQHGDNYIYDDILIGTNKPQATLWIKEDYE